MEFSTTAGSLAKDPIKNMSTTSRLMSLPEELLLQILVDAVPLVCHPELIAASKASAYTVWKANTRVNHAYHRIANEAFINNYVTPVNLSNEASWGDLAALPEAWPKETHHPIHRLRITIQASSRQNIKDAFSELSYGIRPPEWGTPLYAHLREVVILLDTSEPAKKIEDLEERLWRYLLILRRTMNGGRSGTVRLQVTRRCSVSTWALEPDGVHTRRKCRSRERHVHFEDTPVLRRARIHAHTRRSLRGPLATVVIMFAEHRWYRDAIMLITTMLCIVMVGLVQGPEEGLKFSLPMLGILLGWLCFDCKFVARQQQLLLRSVSLPVVLDPGHDSILSGLLLNAGLSINTFLYLSVPRLRVPSAWNLLQTEGLESRRLAGAVQRPPVLTMLAFVLSSCYVHGLLQQWMLGSLLVFPLMLIYWLEW
ncbi:hypothetical protein LTR10_011938 [Elasticomyces elasticus]|nr:hypothetical protein LTR10_011938 [Elasticomyces elasticus]KAK4968879.1 hypothetical protein LTR42_009158 [Elasticomyces elasticus]